MVRGILIYTGCGQLKAAVKKKEEQEQWQWEPRERGSILEGRDGRFSHNSSLDVMVDIGGGTQIIRCTSLP